MGKIEKSKANIQRIGGATIVGLTSIFVYGKKKQEEKFTKQ